MKIGLKLLRLITSCWLGQVLVAVHLILVVYTFAPKPPLTPDFREGFNNCYTIPVAGRALQIPYETPLLQTIGKLDIPSLMVFWVINIFLGLIFADVSVYTASWITAVCLLAITSAQWWIVGFILEHVIRFIRRGLGKSKRAI